MCGEPCPSHCRVCDPDYVDPITLCRLGDDTDDERYIQLQDCGHTFGVEGLDSWMGTQDTGNDAAVHDGAAEGSGQDGGGGGSSGASKAVQLPRCPGCQTSIRRSFRYSAIVRRCISQVHDIKLRTTAGFELRGTVMTALKDCEREHTNKKKVASLNTLLNGMLKRADSNRCAATPRLVIGELLRRKEDLLETMSAAAPEPQRAATAVAEHEPPQQTARLEYAEHLEEALRLVGYSDMGGLGAEYREAFPPLNRKQRITVAHLALLQLGVGMAKSGASQEEGAKRRLLESKRLAAEAQLPVEVDIDLLLRNTEAAARALVQSAMTGVERGSWHECPNGHRYLIGECGGAMEQSKCPDCNAAVGGGSHTLLASNRSVGRTSFDIAMQRAPNQEEIQRAQHGP